jgi:hypothetical protein
LAIARTEAVVADFAMEIGALKLQRPEHALKYLLAPARIAGRVAAPATSLTGFGIGMIGIDSLFDGATGQMECLTANCTLQSLQIQIAKALPAE